MKKILSLTAAVLMLAVVLTGCAKATDSATEAVSDAISAAMDAADQAEVTVPEAVQSESAGTNEDTAATFYSAYLDAKSDVLGRLMDGITNNPDTMMSALSFLGVSMSDLYLLPVMYFGLDDASVAAAMAMMGGKDVTYDQQGNNYTVTYKNSDEKISSLMGTYDKGKSLVATGMIDGKENAFAETYRTAFGYVGQFYFISDDGTGTLYQVAINGQDGVFGIITEGGRPAPLTGNESADFPKSAKEWYAINGSTITGMNADGKAISFEYVPSETDG